MWPMIGLRGGEDEEEPRKKTSWRNLTIMFRRQRRRRPGIGKTFKKVKSFHSNHIYV